MNRFFFLLAIAFCVLAPIRLVYDLAHSEAWDDPMRDPRAYGWMCLGLVIVAIGLVWRARAVGRQWDRWQRQFKAPQRR